MTLKILRFIARSPRGARAAREIERRFGIRRQTVMYHLRRLEAWGLVARDPARPRSPATIYFIAPVRVADVLRALAAVAVSRPMLWGVIRVLVAARARGRGLAAREVAERLGISARQARRYLAELERAGLVIRAGGVSCHALVWVFVWPPWDGPPPHHRHRFAGRHRYKVS